MRRRGKRANENGKEGGKLEKEENRKRERNTWIEKKIGRGTTDKNE